MYRPVGFRCYEYAPTLRPPPLPRIGTLLVTTPTTPLPCPTWCDRGPGHGFRSTDPDTGALVRDHVRDFGDYVALAAAEHAVTPDGPAWSLGAPALSVADDAIGLDVDEAAAFAPEVAAAVEAMRVAGSGGTVTR